MARPLPATCLEAAYYEASSNNMKQVGLAVPSEAPAASRVALSDAPPAPAGAEPAQEETPAVPATAAVARKLVYNAQVSLIVENLTSVEQKLQTLVKSTGGYIADTESVGQARSRTCDVEGTRSGREV